jgi:hypothetical protein
LCPMLAVLYLISHLDRANIGCVVCSKIAQASLIITKECENRRVGEDSRHEGHRLQCRTYGVLRSIRPLRSTL